MTANIPVLPIVVSTVLRAVLEITAPVVRGLKALARALRHRRQARALAGLDCHMLADIGITRADLRDAFSAPFWEDPTDLLAERVGDRRRHGRCAASCLTLVPPAETGFRRPPTDRPARQTV